MRVLYQVTQGSPSGWQTVDHAQWSATAAQPMHGLCVQGDEWEGYDHYAVEDDGSGNVVVTGSCVDPSDWPVGERWAKQAVYYPLAPDPLMGGAWNVRKFYTVWAEGARLDLFNLIYGGNPYVTVLPWDKFEPRPAGVRRNGQWVSEALHNQHRAARTIEGWRTWTEGVPAEELENGQLRQQRPLGRYVIPPGTKTYYMDGATLATGLHNSTAELEIAVAPTGASNITDSGVGANGSLVITGTTLANQPNETPWPTGFYRYQIDCTAVGLDLTYGILTQGTATGHFARVSSDLATELETNVQDQAAFIGAGLKLASYNGSWTAGAAGDRFEVTLAAYRTSGHGNQSITVQVGEIDDFVDGPWTAVGVVVENTSFFGANW